MSARDCTVSWTSEGVLGTQTKAPRLAQELAVCYRDKRNYDKAKVTDKGEMKEVPGSDGEYHYWESDEWYYIDKKGQKSEENRQQ